MISQSRLRCSELIVKFERVFIFSNLPVLGFLVVIRQWCLTLSVDVVPFARDSFLSFGEGVVKLPHLGAPQDLFDVFAFGVDAVVVLDSKSVYRTMDVH